MGPQFESKHLDNPNQILTESCKNLYRIPGDPESPTRILLAVERNAGIALKNDSRSYEGKSSNHAKNVSNDCTQLQVAIHPNVPCNP